MKPVTVSNITILGATGSIGRSTLDVVSRYPERYRVYALTANNRVDEMRLLCERWKPRYAVMRDCESANRLKSILGDCNDTEVLCDEEGLLQVVQADEVDYVVAAIVGAAGLIPTLAAARCGKRVLLANKEALVMSGQLFIDTARDNHAVIMPVDSEHNAIFQCLPNALMENDASVTITNRESGAGIERILLTASGGPFRQFTADQLSSVTPQQAISHPNWDMGKKISVDSATLMNKGLELIEAAWLFDLSVSNIDVVVHPQSVIHSMVTYSDGSVLAQMGNPDMRTPIAHALAWPERIDSGVEPLDLFEVARLDFEKPDMARFPCLRLCYEAIEAGGAATITLNAANEIAVDAFLNEMIGFTDIASVVETVLDKAETSQDIHSLESILQHDQQARRLAYDCVDQLQ
jgi:1-deoxy-D-xylulose-5-phosphate reductoisomerase